jgi:hypothetical protein
LQDLTSQFLAFCRSKPADEEYDYVEPWGCAFAQFANAQGLSFDGVGARHWDDLEGGRHELPIPIQTALTADRLELCERHGLSADHTFGALTARLEVILAERS